MEKQRLLVVVDMQNDFIDGALGTVEAQNIVDNVADFIATWKGDVIATMDTHYSDYLSTREGKKLPMKHCIVDTEGWKLSSKISKAITKGLDNENITYYQKICKNTFGSSELYKFLHEFKDRYQDITFIGVCTGICVISNVVIARTALPEVPLNVIENLCACVTPESHKAAIETMRTLQVNVL